MKVLYWPDPKMTSIVVKDVTEFGPHLKILCDEMAEVMFLSDGVGIAATQVGDSNNIFILDANIVEGIDNSDYVAFINPKITSISEDKEVGIEGCLSFPDIKAPVLRATSIMLEAFTWSGAAIKMECTGFLARAVQHELDHLKHIYLIRHIKGTKKSLVESRMKRELKKSLTK